ncbi:MULTISPECIES: type II secretion system protein N [Psychrobacter]|uniref:type II secretion system protein N n=1 Tax=Psychrobacter TaxID=497 RepID=UPI00146BEA37|nr:MULTISPECIES: type II secretion system protein N [Psychrobacter]
MKRSVVAPVLQTLNRFSGWLLFLAVVWLAWVSARLIWLLIAPPIAPELPLLAMQNNSVAVSDNSSLFTIFAEPKPAEVAAAPPPNVVLKGVMVAVPERFSSALLEVNGEVKNYRINDELQNSGFTLVAVDWNSVVIADRNDKPIVITMRQALPLDQRGMAAGAISNQPLANTIQNPMAGAMPTLPEAPALDSSSGASPNTSAGSSPASAIDEAVNELQDNPANYLSRMGVMASGDGYQVTAAMPSGLRNRLGLEPGDKVLSVNGKTVGNSPAADAAVLQQVQQAKEAQIEVQRGDQTITIRQQF